MTLDNEMTAELIKFLGDGRWGLKYHNSRKRGQENTIECSPSSKKCD